MVVKEDKTELEQRAFKIELGYSKFSFIDCFNQSSFSEQNLVGGAWGYGFKTFTVMSLYRFQLNFSEIVILTIANQF